MGWLRRKKPAPAPALHRGRIFRGGDYWRYQCNDCTYGAGTNGDGATAIRWLLQLANTHADPTHWTRGGA